MPKHVKAAELKRLYDEDPRRCMRFLKEGMDRDERGNRQFSPDDFSIQDLFVGLIENGRELLTLIDPRKSAGNEILRYRELTEAGGAVDTATFSNITGQIVFNRIKEAYEDPEFLWPECVQIINTQFLGGERVPGIGRLGDKSERVGEGAEYPTAGLNEEWIDTVPPLKWGFIVPLTREVVIADRTGVLLKWAAEQGRWLGVKVEKDTLDVVTGQVNNYKRNNVSTNTYLTSGAYINSQTGNALKSAGNEWLALESQELLFDAITDPNTGEPISIVPKTIIVPSALKRTANRIIGATEVQTVDMRANATTIRTAGANPYAGGGLRVLSNQYVKNRSSSATKWWFGNPKDAFAKMTVWEMETLQAVSNNEQEFTRDILHRYKGSQMYVIQVIEPRFMSQSDQ